MIIRGGLNVYPREIEEVLYEHPAVAEAAVGIPDDMKGEEIGAAVTLKPGATATEDELRDFVKDRVAPTSTPHRVVRPRGTAQGPKPGRSSSGRSIRARRSIDGDHRGHPLERQRGPRRTGAALPFVVSGQ